jgi:hypothetical protein
MTRALLISVLCLLAAGCGATAVTERDIEAATATVDFGDYSSSTLTAGAWQARAEKDYPKLFAYTRECVELYGEEGKRMNAAMTDYEPFESAAEKWALNDVGTCLFIMAEAYVDLKMYPDAVKAYRTLAEDYTYAQCWDPRGWYWRPAQNADLKADKYEHLE